MSLLNGSLVREDFQAYSDELYEEDYVVTPPPCSPAEAYLRVRSTQEQLALHRTTVSRYDRLFRAGSHRVARLRCCP